MDAIKPLTIHDLTAGDQFFIVRSDCRNRLYIEAPLRYTGKFVNKDGALLIRGEGIEGLPVPYEHNKEKYAESCGLLVGTEYPMRFGDNHHRAFRYTPEAYEVLGQIVERQDYSEYTQIAGKAVRPTIEQQVQYSLLVAQICAMSEQLGEDSEELLTDLMKKR